MGKGVPVSRATREEIVACYIQGYNVEQTLQQLGGPLRGLRSLPSRATVCRVRSVWRKSGTIALARGRGVGASDQGLSASLAIIIRQWCRRPDGKKRGTRLKRLQSFLHMHPDVNRVVHTSLLCRWLRRLGLTRKKGTRVAKEQDPIKVSMLWTRCQILGLDPDATVWFDESGIDARDWRMERGYAPEGERFETVESISRGHRIDALTSCDTSDAGLFCVEFVHNGTVQYSTFRDHMVNKLLPKMVAQDKKWLIMDNARWHHAHNNEIEGISHAFGVKIVWMATYHPQANPCENLFGNIKTNLEDWRDELEDADLSPAQQARLLHRIHSFKTKACENTT